MFYRIFTSNMATKTANLGILNKQILIFGGVYSNLQALEKIIEIADTNDIAPENCICTGDLVGYCGQPEETLQLFKNWGAHSIIGNVEEQLRNGFVDCGCDFTQGSRCDNLSKLWYPFAQSKVSESSLNWLQTLPDYIAFSFANKNCFVVHGNYNAISEFIFKSTSLEIKLKTFQETQADVVIAGHSGLPFMENHKDKIWINPGVIGMPANDASTKVWCAILSENPSFETQFINFEYEYELAQHYMQINELPAAYAKTLTTGLWDNMDILPVAERNLQGKEINFNQE